MAKALWVTVYHSIKDFVVLQDYAKLGTPALLAHGGRILARGTPHKVYEHGVMERTVVIEFPSVEAAIAAHDSPDYQAAVKLLGNAVEREIRIIEAVE